MVLRTNLSEELAAKLLDNAVQEGMVEAKQAADASIAGGFTVVDTEYDENLHELFAKMFNVTDVDALVAGLTDSGAEPQSPRQVGRPLKRNEAAKAYRRIYPNGHESLGHSWKEALRKLETAGVRVSLRTLKRGIEAKT